MFYNTKLKMFQYFKVFGVGAITHTLLNVFFENHPISGGVISSCIK